MRNAGKLSATPQTCMHVSISITAGHVHGDLAGFLGNFAFDLSQLISRSNETSSKLNVRLLEAISDALARGGPREGELKVEFSVVDDETAIGVIAPPPVASDPSSNEWFPPDTSPPPREIVTKTIRRRRA